MEYRFPAAGNNGRIESQRDNAPGGEELLYQYDELNNPANNRVAGWSYDVNGNVTGAGRPMEMECDGYNRMVRAVNVQGGSEECYGYNQRTGGSTGG